MILTRPELAQRRARLRHLVSNQVELRNVRLRGAEPGALDDVEDEGVGEQDAVGDEATEPTEQVDDVPIPTWASSRAPRHPDANPPPPLPVSTARRFLKHDDKFDNYYDGPTIEEMRNVPETRSIVLGNQILKWAAWNSFLNYGYRLLTSFHQTYHLQPPSPELVMQHFLAVGLDDWNPKAQTSTHVEGGYGLRRTEISALGEKVLVSDALVVAMQDMLKLVSDASTPLATIDVFLAGRVPEPMDTEDGSPAPGPPRKFLCLDLERDAIDVPTEDIEIVTDIDSLVWTGRELKVKGMVSVCTGPTVGGLAAIASHNGCYAEHLAPQSQEDKEGERSSEWLQRRSPHSSIPTIPLFEIGAELANNIMNVNCGFSRMQHRKPGTPFWNTYIPYNIQCLFFKEIILPALAECPETEVELTYMPPTVNYPLYRSRTVSHLKGDHSKLKKHPVGPDQFLKLQRIMRRIIDSNPVRFSLFGSFFLILEAWGIKHMTRRPRSMGRARQVLPRARLWLPARPHNGTTRAGLRGHSDRESRRSDPRPLEDEAHGRLV